MFMTIFTVVTLIASFFTGLYVTFLWWMGVPATDAIWYAAISFFAVVCIENIKYLRSRHA